MPTIWNYLESLNSTKIDLMIDPESEKEYVPWIINNALSQFPDTIHIANEMNISKLSAKMQYHFLLNIIPKRKRFSKWAKSSKIKNTEAVMQYYGYSLTKAKMMLPLLKLKDIEEIHKSIEKGGRTKTYK